MPPRKSPDPKLQTLLEQGIANPRPEAVRDSAFQENEFFDSRDLVQVKYEMLRRVRAEGHSVADAATTFGVSRPTFYKAQTDFERDGLAGLLPGKRGPRGPHKLTVKVMAFVRRALAKNPSLDAAALAKRVEEELGVRVHRRTIERALLRAKKKRR
jgi:transposase